MSTAYALPPHVALGPTLETERLVLRRMIGEPILSVIMITVGLSFFFRALVAFIWGTDTVVFNPPVFPREPLRFFEMVFAQVYLWSFAAAIVLLALLSRTRSMRHCCE